MPLIYLNAGTHSLTPPSVLRALQQSAELYEINPTASLFEAWGELWKIQSELAGFFHAHPDELYLRPNVTAALSDFLLGIPLPASSEILVSDLEYGAIANICRFRAERDSLKLRTFHLPADAEAMARLTPDELLERIVREIRPKTRLLLISHVMAGNGLVIPLEKLAAETRKRGVLLAVDGAHTAGSLPLDFRKLQDVDFFGTNLHKWMLGPKGTSFGWVPRRLHEELRCVQAGWTTYERPAPFAEFGGGSRFAERMLSSACQYFAPHFAIPALLEYWREAGPESILGRLKALQGELLTAMKTHGPDWKLLSPAHPELRGPLLTFELPERLASLGLELMHALLKEHSLQIAIPMIHGRAALRISPHIYNSQAELIQAAQILAKIQI